MPKKKESDQSDVVSAGEPPIDKPAKSGKAAKKAKSSVEHVVDKAIDVEKAVEKVLKRGGKKPKSKAALEPEFAPQVESKLEPASWGDSLMTDVVFRLQAHADVREIALVGDFNGWSQVAHPMTRVGDAFQVTVPLERGRRYRYRYLVDGQQWENDWNADEYVANDYGGDDSVRTV